MEVYSQVRSGTGTLLGYFDGSFVKIRTINLGYNLPASYIKRLKARNIRVYATAEDPFIFSSFVNKYGGLDPESAGTLNLDTPSTWSLIFGVNVSF